MRILVYLFFTLVLLSCNDDDGSPLPDSNVLEWEYGKNIYDEEINGALRNFLIHVPASYDGSVEVPVVMMLHGSGGTGNKFYNISGWVEKSEAENFIAIFPTALEYPLIDGGMQTKWSAGGLVNDVIPGTEIKDDIPFLNAMVELLINSFAIDSKRIYISGFSNGGGFVKSEVVPRMAEVFAAANTTGGVGIPEVAPNQSDRRMPVFNISGTQDSKIKQSRNDPNELPINAADIEADAWLWSRLVNMCEMVGVDTVYQEQVNIPSHNLMIFEEKLDPQAGEYYFMMVKGLEHRYPTTSNNPQGVVAVDELWPWFIKYELE